MTKQLLYRCVIGSQLYGTATQDSDTDYLEVYAETPEQLFGLDTKDSLPQIVTDKEDTNKYWLKQYARLCSRSNPNVIESLYSNKVEFCDPLFRKYILNNKGFFISLDYLNNSHFGFAYSQIKRMEIYSKDRGAARKEYVDKYGYDLKFFSHALRLIYQLEDFCNRGEIQFPLADALIDNLRSIRRGELSHTNALALWATESARIEKTVKRNLVGLRKQPDIGLLNRVLIKFYKELLITNTFIGL